MKSSERPAPSSSDDFEARHGVEAANPEPAAFDAEELAGLARDLEGRLAAEPVRL